tara:strand:- start:1920 stop:2900 length:981 start_codon:yes stop_codon:yes gene_type:complete
MALEHQKHPSIVADVGGTHIRFAVAFHTPQHVELKHWKKLPSKDYSVFADAVCAYQAYLIDQGITPPKFACFAVAGPVSVDQQVQLTNLPWLLCAQNLQQQTGLECVKLINDFEAFAYALALLKPDQLACIKSGHADQNTPISAVGPGTGLGFALYAPQSQAVIPCEGGHQALAAYDPLQARILASMQQELDFVSIEHVLSGTGLSYLYQHWLKVEGKPSTSVKTPYEISEAGLAGHPDCMKVMQIFCHWLAGVAADTVLVQGARSLVFSGGVLPQWLDFIQAECQFAEAFTQRKPMFNYLQQVPVYICMEDKAALMGAAQAFSAE